VFCVAVELLYAEVASGRHRMQHLPHSEGFCQDVIAAEVQYLRPQRLISQAIGHYERRWIRQVLQMLKNIFPAMAIGQAAFAEDDCDGTGTERRLCLRKGMAEAQLPNRMAEYGIE